MRNASHTAAGDWMKLAADSYWLWAEAMMVIGMRTTGMLTRRPGHEREAVRMVSEKLRANAELAGQLAMLGTLEPEKAAQRVVTHYGKRVTANRKRLSRR